MEAERPGQEKPLPLSVNLFLYLYNTRASMFALPEIEIPRLYNVRTMRFTSQYDPLEDRNRMTSCWADNP